MIVAAMAAVLQLIVVSDDPVSFIKLHSPDHLAISVNASEVSTVRDPRQGHFGKGVHCVLVMTNRSFIGVVEDCDTVHRLLKGDKHP